METQSGEPTPTPLEQRAADWVAALQADPSPATLARLDAWLEADPRHAVAFARAECAWEAAARLAAQTGRDSLLRDGDEQVQAQEANPPRVLRRRLIWGAVAALTAVGFWRPAPGGVFQTRVGERRTLLLDDGSRAHLNTGTRLETRFSPAVRDVRLVRGEAMFEVVHDPRRPFVVDAGGAQLRAMGTAFNVRLRPELVELTVTQGVVGVSSGGPVQVHEGAKVGAGEGAAIGTGAVAETRLRPTDLTQRIAWTQGVIELDGQTLDQAVAEFNRYRSKPIVIGDPRLATLRVGGRFPVNDGDSFVRALTAAFPIRALASDGRVLLAPRD